MLTLKLLLIFTMLEVFARCIQGGGGGGGGQGRSQKSGEGVLL